MANIILSCIIITTYSPHIQRILDIMKETMMTSITWNLLDIFEPSFQLVWIEFNHFFRNVTTLFQ